MTALSSKINTLLLITLSLFIFSCGGSKKKKAAKNQVIVHELSDVDMLNPTNYQSASGAYLFSKIHQTLLSVDFKTLDIIPVLAKSRPQIEETDEGQLLITYEIRPEAKWDNGQPITAKDMEFSLKVIKNPKVDCHRIRPYFEFIDSMIFYDDPMKFTFLCKEKYILAEVETGDFTVLPKHIYDPKGLMEQFSISDLNREGNELSANPAIVEFANEYNSPKFQREKGFIVGSGPYEFVEWQTGQRITLIRKKNWWGDALTSENVRFEAYPQKLIYETINDHATAITALKAQKIDIMRAIPPKYFTELPQSEKFNKNFNSYSPMAMVYAYLGINTKLPKFSDKKVRHALAHLVDVDKIIKTIEYGLAQRVIGPVHPVKSGYNKDIKPRDYNIDKAKSLLAEAGWEDSNGNGTLDKMIDGELVEFTIQYIYNSGNDRRKATGLIFQEECRKVGIDVTVTPQEWSVFLENTKNHRFEMYYGAWVGSPFPNDHKQIYHTDSYNGGSNYVGFGNAETDALIEEMRSELDEAKRNELEKEFQEILHDEAAYIYMFAPKERIAIHNRFENADAYVMRPGYWESGLKVASSQAE